MGLDMYLEKRIKGGDNSYPYEDLCYWGKRWPIFHWFKRHLGGNIECSARYLVSKDILIQLRDDCYSVLKEATDGQNIIDIEKAEKYIPISDADCANEYDEYYVNMVSYTLEYTLDIMRTTDFEKYEILFTANW